MDDFLLDLDTLASDTALHLAVQEAELYKKQSKILANRATDTPIEETAMATVYAVADSKIRRVYADQDAAQQAASERERDDIREHSDWGRSPDEYVYAVAEITVACPQGYTIGRSTELWAARDSHGRIRSLHASPAAARHAVPQLDDPARWAWGGPWAAPEWRDEDGGSVLARRTLDSDWHLDENASQYATIGSVAPVTVE